MNALLWLCALYAAHALVLMVIAWRHARRPAEALTWLCLSILVPVIGPLLYTCMARPALTAPPQAQTENDQPRKAAPTGQAPEPSGVRSKPASDADGMHPSGPAARAVASAMERITGVAPQPAEVRVLRNGTETFDHLIRALRLAERTIDVDYYIYRDDHVGRLISGILAARAQDGVRVRFVRDGVGSRAFPRAAVRRLAEAGVRCRIFFPLRFPWITPRLNHRDHCKIVVIDGREAFVGGINVGDEYTGRKPGVGPWRDTHLRMRGAAVAQLGDAFDANWALAEPDPTADTVNPGAHGSRAHGTRDKSDGTAPGEAVGERTPAPPEGRGWARSANAGRSRRLPWRPAMSAAGRMWNVELGPDLVEDAPEPADAWIPVCTQTVVGRPDAPVQAIRDLYFLCITQAQRCVDITTPYFVPDGDILAAMKTAAVRGVRVRLLVPRRCDHRVVGMASRTFYRDLVQAGVAIYLYEPGVLHAKVMQVDDEIAIVGAANYDLRSFRLSHEVCQVMYSRPAAAELTRQFEQDLAHSTRLTVEDLEAAPRWKAALDQAARLLAPLL